jgi:hypothetical protein
VAVLDEKASEFTDAERTNGVHRREVPGHDQQLQSIRPGFFGRLMSLWRRGSTATAAPSSHKR